MKTLKNMILIAIGSISLVLGVIGIFFPVLPTTPFLLLAGACYIRSSKRLYHWLIHHRVLGEYVRNYIEHRAVKKHAKIMAIVMIWTSIPFCIFFLIDPIPIKVMLFLISSMVTIYLLLLKTYTPKMDETKETGQDILPEVNYHK